MGRVIICIHIMGEGERWESEREKRKLHTFDEGSLDRSSNFTTASAIVVAMFCR